MRLDARTAWVAMIVAAVVAMIAAGPVNEAMARAKPAAASKARAARNAPAERQQKAAKPVRTLSSNRRNTAASSKSPAGRASKAGGRSRAERSGTKGRLAHGGKSGRKGGMALARERGKARRAGLKRRAVLAYIRARRLARRLVGRLAALNPQGMLPGQNFAPAVAAVPAKVLFSAKATPAPMAARAIGSYARGCLAGGVMLPVNGKTWQAMRLSRNRNWGHPALVDFIERLSQDGKRYDNWPGLLVGDMAQPMGGPMATGHASHQVGLDADVWLTPMPKRTLSRRAREDMSAKSMLDPADPGKVDTTVWSDRQRAIIRRAAISPEVARIFVHPAIKKALCETASAERGWMSKVRPWYGHHYHFHVRLACPRGETSCQNQTEVPPDDGCGPDLAGWLARVARGAIPAPQVPERDAPPPTFRPRETALSDLPPDCTTVLASDGRRPIAAVPLPIKENAAPITPVPAVTGAVPVLPAAAAAIGAAAQSVLPGPQPKAKALVKVPGPAR